MLKSCTLNKNGQEVSLKSGYQVSTKDVAVIDAKKSAKRLIKKLLTEIKRGQYVGIWVSEGLAYIDISQRVATKCKAIELGITLNQQSIFDWKKESLIWCK